MRKGENEGKPYHFLTKEEFERKIDDSFFFEYKALTTAEGLWYYGTAWKDIESADDKTAIILNPAGCRQMVETFPYSTKVVYIYTNLATIKKRQIERNDEPKEADRRLEQDRIDFKGFEEEADKVFYNNDGTDIDEVVKKIVKYMEGVS